MNTNSTDEQTALDEILAGTPVSAPPATPVSTRDAKGRFLKGNPGGPGVPKGQGAIDIRRAAHDIAAERGIDLPRAVGEVVLRLIEQAKNGDTAAAKLVLDKLGIADPESNQGLVVQVISGVPRADSPTAVGVRVITRNGEEHHAPDND